MAYQADQSEYSEYGAADPYSGYDSTGGYESNYEASRNSRHSRNKGSGSWAILLILLLMFAIGIVFVFLFLTFFSPSTDEEDTEKPSTVLATFRPAPRSPSTPPKATDSSYTRVELAGLICHTTYEKVLATQPTELCDFVIIDLKTLEPFVMKPGDITAIVPYDPAKIEPLFYHLWGNDVRKTILSHPGSVLSQTAKASLPQILRGLRQNIVDNNAHGLALGWPVLQPDDLDFIAPHMKFLSNELDEYHGMLFYDVYKGDSSDLTSFIIEVGSLKAMTLIYRISGKTSIFTHPYYDNFYLNRISEKPLMQVIEEELVTPIKQSGEKVKVAIGMSLIAMGCPANTVYKGTNPTPCSRIPLDTAQAYLMLKQLKKANVSPLAFVLRDHDLDLAANVTYTDHHGKDVPCEAYALGIIQATRFEVGKLI